MNTKEQFIKYSKKLATIDYGKDGPTPIDLVEEILDNLPLQWDNPNLRICDPCFGFGTFLYFSYLRLLKYHDESHILNNMLYGIEIEPFRYELTKKKLKIKNLYLGDSLNPTNKIKEILNMKFDCIVENPPYQQDGNPQVKLWPKFLEKSLKLLKPNGFLVPVSPVVWLKRPDGQKWKNLVNTLKELNINYIKIDDTSSWFKEEKTCIIVLQNRPKKSKTIVESTSGNINKEIDYVGKALFFNEEEKMAHSIIDKMVQIKDKNGLGGFEWFEDIQHNDKKETLIENGTLSRTKESDEYVPLWYTASQMFYTHQKNVNSGYRVLVNLSGHYYSENNPDKYIKVVSNEGCTSGMRSILADSEVEAKNIKKILILKLFRFFNNYQKTSGFNTAMFKLPKLDYRKDWSDKKLYSYFKLSGLELTTSEINLVENYVG